MSAKVLEYQSFQSQVQDTVKHLRQNFLESGKQPKDVNLFTNAQAEMFGEILDPPLPI